MNRPEPDRVDTVALAAVIPPSTDASTLARPASRVDPPVAAPGHPPLGRVETDATGAADGHDVADAAGHMADATSPGVGVAADAPNSRVRGGPSATHQVADPVAIPSGPAARGTIREHREKLEATVAEVDCLVAEHHRRVPLATASLRGAAYARYTTRHQDSIADQVRAQLDEAGRLGVHVPGDRVYFDLALKGGRDRRPGLQALRAALAGAAPPDVVLFFATNRLYRKMYRSIQFVEEDIVGRGLRALFVAQKIDTADERGWRTILQIHAMTDEMVGGMYAENIRAAHEGMTIRGEVCTTLALGYRGRERPGVLSRKGGALRVVEVDPEAAPWVVLVFRWYAEDRLSIGEISRRLNADPAAPRPPKSPSGIWNYASLRVLLTNPRYHGRWIYGASKNTWMPREDYSRQVRRDVPLRVVEREDLRIVPEALWEAAQIRLAQGTRPVGRKARRSPAASRPRLLDGVFHCPVHDRPLYVGGAFGRLLMCFECRHLPAAARPLFTLLNRAMKRCASTCQALVARLADDGPLVAMIVDEARRAAEDQARPDPGEIHRLEAAVAAAGGRIAFVLDNLGDSDHDRREARDRLAALRRQRSADEAELGRLRRASDRLPDVPDVAEARRLVAGLAAVLAGVAAGGDAGDAAAGATPSAAAA